MNQSDSQSLPPDYFDALYQEDPDPWKFQTSEYEAKKYAATLAALPKPRYRSALEIGGSIGILTAKLAERCEALLSLDVSATAQKQAVERCRNQPHVRFKLMQVPQSYPDEQFDLTILSEVGYYWCWEDLKKAQQLMLHHLQSQGHLLLVHWTPYAEYYDNPLNGDQVHESFLELAPTKLRHLTAQREAQYRLDLFERVENGSAS